MAKVNSNVVKLDKKLPSILGTFEGKCCDSNIFNNNDMKLNRELFEKLMASEEFQDAMSHNYYIGYLGHPADPNCMDFMNACIVMKKMWMDNNGDVFGTFDLIDTPVGRVVKSFIDAGVEFGISIRGAGDVDNEGNVDPDTFVFRGFDLVTFPAYTDCVPTFQAIAASTDAKKKVKYKKVCAAVMNNLSDITSASALESAQTMFKENSDEYKAISARIGELDVAASTKLNSDANIQPDKVKGMTQLYLAEVKANKELKAEVAKLHRIISASRSRTIDAKKDLTSSDAKISKLTSRLNQARSELNRAQMQVHDTKVACNKKINSFKRIVASQIKDLTSDRDEMESKFSTQVKANKELSDKIKSLESKNLEYVRKIEATSKAISQKDSTISSLEQNLRETVTANTKIKQEASNRDDKERMLQKRVDAAEQMVLKYQEAYANMYANALGVHIDNLSVTAATSVDQLQKLIASKVTSPECTSRTDDVDIYDVDTNLPDDGLTTM